MVLRANLNHSKALDEELSAFISSTYLRTGPAGKGPEFIANTPLSIKLNFEGVRLQRHCLANFVYYSKQLLMAGVSTMKFSKGGEFSLVSKRIEGS